MSGPYGLPRGFLDRLRGRTLVTSFTHDGRRVSVSYSPSALVSTSAAIGLDGQKRPNVVETIRWLAAVLVELDERPFSLDEARANRELVEGAVEAVIAHFAAWVACRGYQLGGPRHPHAGKRKRRRR